MEKAFALVVASTVFAIFFSGFAYAYHCNAGEACYMLGDSYPNLDYLSPGDCWGGQESHCEGNTVKYHSCLGCQPVNSRLYGVCGGDSDSETACTGDTPDCVEVTDSSTGSNYALCKKVCSVDLCPKPNCVSDAQIATYTCVVTTVDDPAFDGRGFACLQVITDCPVGTVCAVLPGEEGAKCLGYTGPFPDGSYAEVGAGGGGYAPSEESAVEGDYVPSPKGAGALAFWIGGALVLGLVVAGYSVWRSK